MKVLSKDITNGKVGICLENGEQKIVVFQNGQADVEENIANELAKLPEFVVISEKKDAKPPKEAKTEAKPEAKGKEKPAPESDKKEKEKETESTGK